MILQSHTDKAAYNTRFGNMAGRRIYSQLFIRYLAFVPADEYSRAVFLIINFCIFIQQQLRADDFQIPPHRQAVTVSCNFKIPHYADSQREIQRMF